MFRRNKLLAGAFEDLESNLETQEVEEVAPLEKEEAIVEEAQAEENVENIAALAEDIEQDAVNIAEIEGQPVDPEVAGENNENAEVLPEPTVSAGDEEAIEEAVVDSEASLESWSKVFAGVSRKAIKAHFNRVTTESFSNDKLGQLKRNYAIKKMILKEAVEAFHKDSGNKIGFIEGLVNKFRTVKGEMQHYKKAGQKLIEKAKQAKEEGKQIDSSLEISAKGMIMMSELPDICIDNYLKFYNEKSKGADLAGLPKINNINWVPVEKGSDLKGYKPIGCASFGYDKYSETENNRNSGQMQQSKQQVLCFDINSLQVEGSAFISGVVGVANKGTTFGSIDEAIKAMEELDGRYEEHLSKLETLTKGISGFMKKNGVEQKAAAGAVGAGIGTGVGIAATTGAVAAGALVSGGTALAAGVLFSIPKVRNWFMANAKISKMTKAQYLYKDFYKTQEEIFKCISKKAPKAEGNGEEGQE